ncbi:hypothetical protein [Spiroplasma poulsonii]|uniref:hypothetical protein n=1 Tax=Spiroplasma poulsonii TaxID=2138 RepID=UPI001056FB9B|nr:hypothetical protein [Spiroplasma poulsonii]
MRGPLYNEYASIMQYATATAEQVAWLPNAGQALYNLTHRVVWQNVIHYQMVEQLNNGINKNSSTYW